MDRTDTSYYIRNEFLDQRLKVDNIKLTFDSENEIPSRFRTSAMMAWNSIMLVLLHVKHKPYDCLRENFYAGNEQDGKLRNRYHHLDINLEELQRLHEVRRLCRQKNKRVEKVHSVWSEESSRPVSALVKKSEDGDCFINASEDVCEVEEVTVHEDSTFSEGARKLCTSRESGAKPEPVNETTTTKEDAQGFEDVKDRLRCSPQVELERHEPQEASGNNLHPESLLVYYRENLLPVRAFTPEAIEHLRWMDARDMGLLMLNVPSARWLRFLGLTIIHRTRASACDRVWQILDTIEEYVKPMRIPGQPVRRRRSVIARKIKNSLRRLLCIVCHRRFK